MDEASTRCPSCGCAIEAYLAGQSYTERLLAALNHPEPETPVRAAYILGMRGDQVAVPFLLTKAEETSDMYLALACLEALSRIGGEEAMQGVRHFCGDRRFMVAQKARDLLGMCPGTGIDAPSKAG